MNKEFLIKLQKAHEQGTFAAFVKSSAASEELFEILPQLRGLDKVPQNPRWHPEGDVWVHTLLVLDNLPKNATFAMALAALFHDTGKAATTVIRENGAITAYGHEGVSEKIAIEILDSLNADAELKSEVAFLVRYHMVAHSKDAKKKTLIRLIREGSRRLVDQLLQHGVADVASGCKDFTECDRLRLLFNEIQENE